MKLSKIATPMPKVVCAIDASTNSLAFALFVDKQLGNIGKIKFEALN